MCHPDYYGVQPFFLLAPVAFSRKHFLRTANEATPFPSLSSCAPVKDRENPEAGVGTKLLEKLMSPFSLFSVLFCFVFNGIIKTALMTPGCRQPWFLPAFVAFSRGETIPASL